MDGMQQRERAIEACRILNDFIGDFAGAANGIEVFDALTERANVSMQTRVVMRRIFVSHLILTLAKWMEFYERYKRVIPPDCIPACRGVYDEAKHRKVLEFRNKCIGHIWDKRRKRPLTFEEIDEYLASIAGADRDRFLKWFSDRALGAGAYPKTVVSIAAHTRTRIVEAHSLSDQDWEPPRESPVVDG